MHETCITGVEAQGSNVLVVTALHLCIGVWDLCIGRRRWQCITYMHWSVHKTILHGIWWWYACKVFHCSGSHGHWRCQHVCRHCIASVHWSVRTMHWKEKMAMHNTHAMECTHNCIASWRSVHWSVYDGAMHERCCTRAEAMALNVSTLHWSVPPTL